MNKNDVLFLLVVLFIMYYLTQQATGYQTMKPSRYQTIGGLTPHASWHRGAYSPELGIWVSVAKPGGSTTEAVSAYSYDGIKWIMNDSASGGLPVQYGPMVQYGWKSVAYGRTPNGPLFVAVSDGWDQLAVPYYPSYYVDGQLQPGDVYSSVATSTDGINWVIGNSLYPICSWNSIVYNPVTNYFIVNGVLGTNTQNVTTTAMSLDGISWVYLNNSQATYSPSVYGSHGVVISGTYTAGGTQLLTNGSTTWTLSNSLPLNEQITGVKFLQGAYYAVGNYGLYESTDGQNWTNLNPTDVFGNTLLNVTGTNNGIRSDIEYFKGNFILHITNQTWTAGNFTYQSGQFYYSRYAQGPYELGIYGNIPVDDYEIKLSKGDLNLNGGNDILIGLGWSLSGQSCPVYSHDGITWNKT